MTDTKPWYLSRTVWASIVTTLTAGLGLAGLPVQDFDHGALTEALLHVVGALAGVIALLGRLRAKARIG